LQLNLSGANFWEWANCRTYISEVWRAIARFEWPGGPAARDIVQQYIDSLNARDVTQVVNLYNPNAVHINAARTIQGTTTIRSWYQSLLTQVLSDATFTLTGYSGTGNSRHFNWTATSPDGKVSNGSDTFGLLDGKIGYHYTFFDVVK